MAAEHEPLLRDLYVAFNARDVDAVLAHMHPDVDWPNAFEGGRVHGREAVREYWSRQFEQIDPHVEPERFTATEDGRLAVGVHQVVRDLDGNIVSDSHVEHVYSFRDGRVAHMEIRDA